MVGRGRPGAKGRGRGRKVREQTPPQSPKQDAEVESNGEPASLACTSQTESPDNTLQSCSQPNNKKAKVLTNLKDEQEEAMIEWLTEHPEVYNKKLNQYKDTKSKTVLWEAKARELDLDYLSVLTWYKSLRSRYGKLKMKKSGDGAPELTDGEKWVLQNFAFLDGHINRVKTRPLVRSKIGHAAFTPGDDVEVDPVTQSSDDDDTSTATNGTGIDNKTPKCSSVGTSHLSNGKGKGKSTIVPDEDDLIRRMAETVETSRQLQERVMTMPKLTERARFGDFLKTGMETIHPSLWRSFQREFSGMLWRYQDQSEQLNTYQSRSSNSSQQCSQMQPPPSSTFSVFPDVAV